MAGHERVREPAVAGYFYPSDRTALCAAIEMSFRGARKIDVPAAIKAIIVPHAGYVYSGVIAAGAYRLLKDSVHPVRRVIAFGPSHRVAFRGAALPGVDFFRTPLGLIEIDQAWREQVMRYDDVQVLDAAHAGEHSVEVQLPYLQTVIGDFRLLPVVLGRGGAAAVSRILADCGDDDTLIVVSSDLSHYHEYGDARTLDSQTARAIEALDGTALAPQRACGHEGIRGLLAHASTRHWSVHPVDIRNSGDTAGSKDSVVGYGAWVLT